LGRQTDGYMVGQTDIWTDSLMLGRQEAKWMQRQMNRWTDGWTDGYMDRWLDRQVKRTDGWADRQMVIGLDRQKDGQTSLCWTDLKLNGCKDERTDEQMDRQLSNCMYRQMDRWSDGRMDR
jgi:hypothetical protein